MRFQIWGWTLSLEKGQSREQKAEFYRAQVKANAISRIEGVKHVRNLFNHTDDKRAYLKGALDFIDGK